MPYYDQNPLNQFNVLYPLDKVDLEWAGKADPSSKDFSNYYDYYFSGEDIKVFIDGLYGVEDELDLAGFAYSVRQEKQPLYGFWSYNYDTVMLGTRIIVGEFSLYTKYPQRMTKLLQKSAQNRVEAERFGGDEANTILTKMSSDYARTPSDEANVQKYWSYSQLDRITNDIYSKSINGTNIFSAHPPFNFVIVYGAEQTAVTPRDILNSEDIQVEETIDRIISSDVNERNVKVDSLNNPMKIVIQQVNLTAMTNSYNVGGSPLVETYQFMARDYYFMDANVDFIKNMKTTSTSDTHNSATNDSPIGTDSEGNPIWEVIEAPPEPVPYNPEDYPFSNV